MIRFKNTAYVVLILGLLLSHTPLSHSQVPSTHQGTLDVIPATYEGTFIHPKWTWNRVFPTKDGNFRTPNVFDDEFPFRVFPTKDEDLRMELNLTFDPMIVHVKLPGEIRFYRGQSTLKLDGTEGHFSVQGGVALTGDVIMHFNLPSLSRFLMGMNADIRIARKIPVSYVNYPFGGTDGKWNETVVLDNYLLRGPRTGNSSIYMPKVISYGVLSFTHSSGRPVLNLRTDTPGHIGIGAWPTDIAANIADGLEAPYRGSHDKSAKIIANHLKDYLDADMYFIFRIWSEYTFACKAFTINGTPVTEENQVIPAPDFDPTKSEYKIKSSYDEEFTYALNLDVSSSYAAAKFVVLKEIELWSYEAEVTEKHVPLLPKKRYDIDFKEVSAKMTINPYRFRRAREETIGGSREIIPDADLHGAIRRELGLDRDDPPTTRADLRRLTHLTAGSVRHLNGLQHAVNLRSLEFSGYFSELSLPSNLKKLESLAVSSHTLYEISLSKFPKLESLAVDGPLSKLSLSNLPNLTTLQLPTGTVSEVSLSNLKNLESLDLIANPLSKVSLSNLPKLTALRLVNNTLSELSLSNLKSLKYLVVESSTISKLSLSNLPSLHTVNEHRRTGGWGLLPFERPLDVNLSHLGISELSLSKLKNLKELDLSDNHLSDLSFLKDVENLTHLNLSNNGLSELVFPEVFSLNNPRLILLNLSNNLLTTQSATLVSGFLDLKHLDLSHNRISGALYVGSVLHTELALNRKLTHLNLDNNLLSGILHLKWSDFRHLTDLYLNNNQFSEVSLSRGPRNLKLIRLKNNPVSKVSLSNLPNLTYLGSIIGPGSHLSEVSLSRLTNMRDLSLGECPLLSKVSVSDLPNLEHLNIFSDPLLSEVSLTGIPNLKYLRFAWNDSLSTLSLSELPNLTTLICFDTSVSDVSGLSHLINLTKLDLRHNAITNVSGLSNLTNLMELYLTNNAISDVSGLSNLTSLTKLDLRNNLISDVTPLSNLTNLTKLDISNNLISDVIPFSNLTNLTELELSNNFISDVTPLSNLTNLPVWSVGFSNNPLNPDLFRAYGEAMGMIIPPPSDLPVLIKISGDDQIGAPGETLPEPFVVQALDEKERPVSGARIKFFAYEGNGTFSTGIPVGVHVTLNTGITTDVVTTDVNGKAEIILTLGPNPGPNRVAAIGYDGFKASFTATATLAEGTPGQIAADTNGNDADDIQVEDANGNDATNIQAENPNGDDAANIQVEDVNSDGVVNIQDLVFISSHLGQTGEHAADVSGDGVVDIRDLVRVSATLR